MSNINIDATGATGANPTATASDVAVNGSATTFLRSDGAPAVQKGSSSQFGVLKVDGTTITASGGVISASGGGTVSTTGSPASGNLTKFSGASSITNGDLSGDVTTSSTLVTTIKNDVALAGNPTTTTQSAGNNTTRIATTAFVTAAVSAGGLSPGTPPTIVQNGFSTGSTGVTLGVAPTNGNLLVAIAKSSSAAVGAGWTSESLNSGGLDFNQVFTKVAGAGESTTQSPLGGGTTANAISMWELNGQSGTPVVFASATFTAATKYFTSDWRPGLTNVLALAAAQTDGTTPQTLNALKNMTQDTLDNASVNVHQVAGHSNGSTPVAQLVGSFSGTTVAIRLGIILVTS